MAIGIIKAAIDMLKSISELCKKVIDAGDPEKYVRSVNELNLGISDTYDEMRKIIVNDEKFTADEKLKRLKELADGEAKTKARCDEAIKGNRDNVSKVVLEILAGFLTCGISFTPAIVKSIKNSIANNEDIPSLDNVETVYEITEYSNV